MSRSSLFLGLALVGLASQAAILGVFLANEGVDLAEFGSQAVETTIAVLALGDLLMCGLVYLLWLPGEARRAGVDPWWPYAVAVVGGLCFALPLFLAARARRGETAAAAP
jgi:uncharacterized protein DUF2834